MMRQQRIRRSKAETEEQKSHIMKMPELVTTLILSRLPVKSIFTCRCVCKIWLNLLLESHFAKIHYSGSTVEFLLRSTTCSNEPYFLGELDEDSFMKEGDVDFRVRKKSVMKFRVPPTLMQKNFTSIYSGCDGFVCLFKRSLVLTPEIDWNPYHIFNPVTGDHVIVQQPAKEHCRMVAYRLGSSSKTKEFKLLRFLNGVQPYGSLTVRVDIHTLGSNTWTDIGDAPYGLSLLHPAPFLNGAIHWTFELAREKQDLISSFDFEEEKFSDVPAPYYFSDKNCSKVCRFMSLGSLGGCLCLCYRQREVECDLDIWVMTDYGKQDSWTKKYVINEMPLYSICQPLRIMKNKEILVLGYDYLGSYLLSYNSRTNKCRYIKFFGKTKHMYAIFPHVPSFIRLPTPAAVEGGNC